MPRLMSDSDTDASMSAHAIGGMQAFTFSGKRVEHLGASEYTLASIAIDLTGSVELFCKELRDALVTAVSACKKSPRANNLLLRVVFFNSSIGVLEVHGFKPLSEIEVDDYPDLYSGYGPSVPPDKVSKKDGTTTIKPQRVYGATNLYDAVFSSVGAVNAYAKTLMDQEFLANGIVVVITDGDDNQSSVGVAAIAAEVEKGTKAESIESLIPILVGINAGTFSHRLKALSDGVKMQYLDAGDATPGKLAKLAAFVSTSISSQSQSLGTGGPSQNIAAVI